MCAEFYLFIYTINIYYEITINLGILNNCIYCIILCLQFGSEDWIEA